jgi:hypothetical protein
MKEKRKEYDPRCEMRVSRETGAFLKGTLEWHSAGTDARCAILSPFSSLFLSFLSFSIYYVAPQRGE